MAKIATTTEDVSKSEIDAFLAERAKAKSEGRDAASEIGKLHKDMVERKGLSKKGLLMFTQMAELEPNKRADSLRTFDMLRRLKGNEWAQGDLVDQAES